MTFSLPESLQTFVAQQVASGKYPNAEAYLQALIEADQRQQAREHLDALLEEGLASPTGEMTAQDWEHIRRRVREHYTAQQRR
jgi:antitoxin ParD1/3/4